MTDVDMSRVYKRAFGGLFQYVFTTSAVVFIAAGTLDYWQTWQAMAVWFVSGLAITLYLIKYNPALLVRRTEIGPGSEKGAKQKLIVYAMISSYFAGAVVPGLDHRFGWSEVPLEGVIAGDVVMVLGFLMVFWVFKVNSYTSGNINVGAEQKVISTGPYGLVRHPMYVGLILLYAGASPALGSWWGILGALPMVFTLAWRLVDEESVLATQLPGYGDYRNQVRYRLVPFVW